MDQVIGRLDIHLEPPRQQRPPIIRLMVHRRPQRGRQPMRSPSIVTPRNTIAISSVVPSPQLAGRGRWFGWRTFAAELSKTAGISMRVPAGMGTGWANV